MNEVSKAVFENLPKKRMIMDEYLRMVKNEM